MGNEEAVQCDAAGQVTSIIHLGASGVLQSLYYTYDDDGQRTETEAGPVVTERALIYDAQKLLAEADDAGMRRWMRAGRSRLA